MNYIRITILMLTSLFFFISIYSQNFIGNNVLIKKRAELTEINNLMRKGIMEEPKSKMSYFTGYNYKTLYDWDQYFEAIVQIYMGWPSDYIKNGVLLF